MCYSMHYASYHIVVYISTISTMYYDSIQYTVYYSSTTLVLLLLAMYTTNTNTNISLCV